MGWNAMCRLLLAGLLVVAGPRAAEAIGHYQAGLLNARDFFLPPPGFYFANYTYWYHSDTFKDRTGATVDEITVNIPGVGPRTVEVDTELNLVTVVPALMWAPDWDFYGVRWGIFVAQGFANTSLNSAINDIDRGLGVETGWGAADLYVQPLWLQWSSQHLDVILSYGFYAPTGRFEVGAPDNVGLGYWEHQVQAGGAFYFDQAKTFSIVLMNTWEMNQDIQGLDVHPGTRFNFNWALSKIWLDGYLETAVIGYDQWLMEANSGSDVVAFRRGVLDEVHAAGVQLGIPKLGLSLHYLHEFEAKARFQGSLLTFSFGLPLDQLVKGIGSVFE
jgi:hypothetical protein